MNSEPHKRISALRTEPALFPWTFFCQPEGRTTHACSCLVIYVCTHVRTQKTIVIYSFLSCLLLFPFFSFSLSSYTPHPPQPHLSRHSCREQSNDACLSETWWIVMNQACVSIWGKARGRRREGKKGLWVRRKRGGEAAWVKTGLLLRHWCSSEKHSGDWQAIQLH